MARIGGKLPYLICNKPISQHVRSLVKVQGICHRVSHERQRYASVKVIEGKLGSDGSACVFVRSEKSRELWIGDHHKRIQRGQTKDAWLDLLKATWPVAGDAVGDRSTSVSRPTRRPRIAYSQQQLWQAVSPGRALKGRPFKHPSLSNACRSTARVIRHGRYQVAMRLSDCCWKGKQSSVEA